MIFTETTFYKAWDAYNKETSSRFYQYLQAIIVLLIYELFLGIFSTPNIKAYNGIDAWFWLASTFVTTGTLMFSLGLIIYRFWFVYLDWFGLFDKEELKRAKEKAKKEKKKISDFRKKPLRKPGAVNWYYFGIMVVEGFVYGSFLYLLLPTFTFIITAIISLDVNVNTQLDAVGSLRDYHTNFGQDIALAFGGGFYDEFIFRGLLIALLVRIFSKELGSFSGKDLRSGNIGKFIKVDTKSLTKLDKYIMYHQDISRKRRKLNDRVTIFVVASLLYSLSHFLLPFGDEFTIYNILYRLFFGIVLCYVFANRRLSIAVWTHVFYNLWYFLLV